MASTCLPTRRYDIACKWRPTLRWWAARQSPEVQALLADTESPLPPFHAKAHRCAAVTVLRLPCTVPYTPHHNLSSLSPGHLLPDLLLKQVSVFEEY